MLRVLRYLTSGESHGKCLNAIIEGIPFGYELDFDFINSELASRQKGHGRGNRMKIETDKVQFNSGVRFSKTTASPISLTIENKDWQNWLYPMSVEKLDLSKFDKKTKAEILNKIEEKKVTKFRPAHADLAGAQKYGFDDIRYVLERSSARETATRVALGAICQNILKNYDILFKSDILAIGGCENKKDFKNVIDKAILDGDSLGGLIRITVKNVPVGLGSFVNWDRKLDARLAGAIASIPAIKSVEFGLGKDYASLSGSKSHDEIFYKEKYFRKTNASGGIEGGMSNGEDIVVTIAMKPIPTLKKPLNSVEMKTHKKVKAHFERTDSCAVEACSVVARNVCAIVILDAFLEKFGCDSKKDIDDSYKKYLKRINEI